MSSAAAQTRRKMTREEYLEFELHSPLRHEFYRGEAFAMTGGSDTHSRLKVRLIRLLDAETEGTDCRTYDCDMRVLVEATGLYTYPDASVGCGEPRFEDERRNSLLNPRAICEVLSKSSEAYDRGTKWENYREIPSLQHYVLVSQKKRMVELYSRDGEGEWAFRIARDGERLALEAIGCVLDLKRLYDNIELVEEEDFHPDRE